MDPIGRALTGTCAFRLMPSDDLAPAPSTAVLSQLASQAWNLAYTWEHASGGEQRGGLVIGSPGEDGQVEAAWFDSWHQQPAIMRLTGNSTESGASLLGTYAEEWGWTITLEADGDTVRMTMCNVIPDSALAQAPPDAPPMSAGPYDVMVAEWTSRAG
ncbi:MAG: hypothetical protein V9G19_21135 [Tetrasphaera sp.]